MGYEFDGEIRLLEGKMKWNVIYFPYSVKVLNESGILNEFLKQSNYIKREQINFIELAKKEETKNSRANALVDKIKGIN